MAEPGNQILKGERSRSKISKKTKPESFYHNRNTDSNDEATIEMANECSEFPRKRKNTAQHLERKGKRLKSKGSKSSSGRGCNKSGKSIFNTDNTKEIWHMTFKSDSIEESERSLKVKFTRTPYKEIESKEVQTYKMEPIYLPPTKNTCSEVLLMTDDHISKINQSESIKSDEEKPKNVNPPEDQERSQLHELRLNSEFPQSKPTTKRAKPKQLQDSETHKLREIQPTPNENRIDENNSVLPERKSKIERKQKKRKHNSSNSKRFDQSKETANCSKDTKRILREEEIDNELTQYQPATKKAKLDTKQMESNLNDLNEAFGEMLSQGDSLASSGDMSKKEVNTLKKTFKKMIKLVTKKIKKYEKPTSIESEKDSQKAKGVTQAFGEKLNQVDCLDSTVRLLTLPSMTAIKKPQDQKFSSPER